MTMTRQRMVSNELFVCNLLLFLEYLHLYIASKVEAKKIFGNARFEEVVSKFW